MSSRLRLQNTPSLAPARVSIDSKGGVYASAKDVLVSPPLSPEAKTYWADHLGYLQDPEIQLQANELPRYREPYLYRQRALYAVKREDRRVGAAHAYAYTPELGIAPQNRNRVMMNLHVVGFTGGWPGCAQRESVSISGLERIRVRS